VDLQAEVGGQAADGRLVIELTDWEEAARQVGAADTEEDVGLVLGEVARAREEDRPGGDVGRWERGKVGVG